MSRFILLFIFCLCLANCAQNFGRNEQGLGKSPCACVQEEITNEARTAA